MIAVGILGIGVVTISLVMSGNVRNSNVNKNQIIAVNLAREGVEAVRNIRDSNWIKYANNRRLCWNHSFASTVPCDNSFQDPIQAGQYIIYKRETLEDWVLEGIANFITSSGPNDPSEPCFNTDTFYQTTKNTTLICRDTSWGDMAKLYLVDIDPTTDSDIRLDEDGDTDPTNDIALNKDIYNHNLTPLSDVLGKNNVVDSSLFNRIITIEYLSNNGTIRTSGTPPQGENRMRITSTVDWIEGGIPRKVELKTHITDYLGREDLSL